MAVGRGIVPTVRSLKVMDTFIARQGRPIPPKVEPRHRPSALQTAFDGGHEIVSFADAAALALDYGLPIAPYVVLDALSPSLSVVLALPATDHYVVKLADVLHRTDIGAVATGVTTAMLPDAIQQMADIATRHGLATSVLVQPELHGAGEIFLGAHSSGDLGSIVVFGVGGVFVEVIGDISARLAPLTIDDALDMLGEIKARGVLAGTRGGNPWNLRRLASVIVDFGNFAFATRGWLSSIEINPLLAIDDGFVAVDLSLVVRP